MKFICLFMSLIFCLASLSVPVEAAQYEIDSILLPSAAVNREFLYDHFNQQLLHDQLIAQPLKQEADADIQCTLDPDLAAESYVIRADEQIQVTAGDEAGLFYGLNTLRGMLKSDTLTPGVYEFTPQTKERALLLDLGRKYYSPAQIRQLIDLMAANRLNALVMHFSESSGLRIESKKYPWLAGSDIKLSRFPQEKDPDENKVLTQAEVREIAAYARQRNIELIPSLDSPGHSGYMLAQILKHTGKDFRARFNFGGQEGAVIPDTWDLANPEARQFLRSIIDEYAQFFYSLGARTFDMGGDEMLGSGRSYIGTDSKVKWQALASWQQEAQQLSGKSYAVPYDLFMWYMNDLSQYLKNNGYINTRMWNDELYRTHDTAWNQAVKPDPGIQVEWWNSDGGLFLNPPGLYVDKGHNLINATNFYNYYILDPQLRYLGVFGNAIYREYESSRFIYNWVEPQHIKGSYFCIWADNPVWQSADEVLAGIKPLLFYNGLKLFDPTLPERVSYKQLQEIYHLLN